MLIIIIIIIGLSWFIDRHALYVIPREKVKIIFLGAGGVGKTSILLQAAVRLLFVFSPFFRSLVGGESSHCRALPVRPRGVTPQDGIFLPDRPPTIGVGLYSLEPQLDVESGDL